jgi:hypothetical protein
MDKERLDGQTALNTAIIQADSAVVASMTTVSFVPRMGPAKWPRRRTIPIGRIS